MELECIYVDLVHIFDDENYREIRKFSNQGNISVVEKGNFKKYYFLIKKSERFIPKAKESFYNKSEKSFGLIHISVINLSGFSIEKPYLYYKYIDNPRGINDIELTDINIQIMFLGIASGLSYLLSKGYFYSNFSIDSIVFDKKNHPKLFDYIILDDSDVMFESDLIIKYVDILNIIINKKKKQKPDTIINDELESLIKRCEAKTNLPTFENFIQFFQSKSYRTNCDVIDQSLFTEYSQLLEYTDKVIYDEKLISEFDVWDSEYKCSSVEQILYYFYERGYCSFNEENLFILNSLPSYYIRSMASYLSSFQRKLVKYLVFDDFMNDSIIGEKNVFLAYLELMEQIKKLEDEKNEHVYYSKRRKRLDIEIEKIRIKAINYLKKASSNSNDCKAKIELAVQYINGNILPYNLTKALSTLNSIVGADEQTQQLIGQMKNKIQSKIQSTLVKNILPKLPPKQKEILQNAEGGNVLSLLFVGFAFYFGFNGFPISRSLSIYYYREAAKKSPYAMYVLGYLYFEGIIFPRNFKRARNCFKRSADSGYLKAEIVDCFLRKHLSRTYLLDFKFKEILKFYLPTFNSMIPNDSYVFPRINHFLESNLHNDTLYEVKIEKSEKYHSEKVDENCSMYLSLIENKEYKKKIKPLFSKKVLLSSENMPDTNNLTSDDLCKIGKSYFQGNNNFPINYSMSLDFFKLAADKGNSEAQWRYALMVLNSLGSKGDFEEVERYLQESSRQNNLRGKLYYAIFLRENGDNQIFERLINECCNAGSLDAMYYYALHLENVDKSLDQSMYYYQKAADQGHLDSLIRLIYIFKHRSLTDLYENYLNLAVSMLNESLLVKLINYYDINKRYDQSNILIEAGIRLNFKLFNAYYADHLLYGKGMDEPNVKRAQKLVYRAIRDSFSDVYCERYIYVALEKLIMNNQHEKAVLFLLKQKDKITTKHRSKFLAFYKKLDKNIAQEYFITVNYCCQEYRDIHSRLMEIKKAKSKNYLPLYYKLTNEATYDDNPYAFVTLGKMCKNGTSVPRDLKKAVQYFEAAAKLKCPEGYFYLGKEYLLGRILDQKFELAKKFLLKAFKKSGEPRAGYYLYKIPNICDDNDVDDVKLLQISAGFGYKRALYQYGELLLTGKDKRINVDKTKGIRLIQQAAYQKHKKAIRYCKLHGIRYKENEENQEIIHQIDDESLSELSSNSTIERNVSLNTVREDRQSSELNNDEDESNSDILFWL